MNKFLIVRYPDSQDDCSIEEFETFEELEKAVKDNYTSSRVIACKILEQKVILED